MIPGSKSDHPGFRKSFLFAIQGFRTAVATERNIKVMLAVGALAVAAGLVIGLDLVSWAVILLCCAVVIMAELFNTAIETDRGRARLRQRHLQLGAPPRGGSMPEKNAEKDEPFRSGFVALVGRPNAGKSTLLNACMGEKVAITSPVAQTTRRRMRAVINTPGSQLVIIDTPGLHKPKDALGSELNKAALAELADADVVAFLVDATKPVGRGDEWVARHVDSAEADYKLLVLTKADIAGPEQVAAQLEAARALCRFDDELVVSATEGFNVDAFLALVSAHLPEGPRWFPEGMDVDATPEDLVAEFVREKLFLHLRQELPHSVGVLCDEIDYADDGHASICATILVERDGQKGIVLGRGGQMIKRVGIEARRDIERLLGCKVFLDLTVRVAPQWRRDEREIRRLGYGLEE